MKIRLDVVQGRGVPQRLELEAPSLADARVQAEQQGLRVLSASAASPFAATLSFGSGPSLLVPVFVEQLRDLLTAGLSVIEALATLQAGASLKHRPALDQLVRDLRAGRRLSDALAAQPVFPPLLVALVRASELTSDLPQGLSRYLEHEQRVSELRHKIASVAIYPALVTAIGGVVLLFLALYVMPRFAGIFEGMNGELPWSARAMVAWSGWLHGHGGVLAGIAAALVLLALFAATSPPLRRAALQRLLDLGPLRQRLRTYFLARWYRATGMLVEGGIPLPDALRLATGLLPLVLQPGGHAVEQAVRDGHSPAQGYRRGDMTTPVAEQLLQAGERTGDLGNVLTRIAQFHEAEVTRSLERGMKILEPVVMTLIGLGVGTVVVLMYLPIFELAAAIQ
jgi:general secretion pathway protein F